MDSCFIVYWTNASGLAQSFAYATHEEAFGHWRAFGGAIEHHHGMTADAYNARHDRRIATSEYGIRD